MNEYVEQGFREEIEKIAVNYAQLNPKAAGMVRSLFKKYGPKAQSHIDQVIRQGQIQRTGGVK